MNAGPYAPGPDSPVFLVGAARSGTTWLQLLLSQHPAVATSQETHLFSAYLSPFLRRWDYEVEPDVARRRVGLSTVLSESEFLGMCRNVAAVVLEKILASKPGASIALEKSPNHVMDWRYIRRVIPDARFIVLHRDPRAVASSLIAASATWGSGWAADNALEAARYWRNHIMEGQRLIAAVPDTVVVRYEDLESDGPGTLFGLFRWLGLPVSEQECRRYVEATRAKRLAGSGKADRSGRKESVAEPVPEVPWDLATEPEGFYRAATRAGWEEELSSADIRRIEYETGDLMAQLGYARHGPVRDSPGLAVRVRDAGNRLLNGIEWRARRWLRRL